MNPRTIGGLSEDFDSMINWNDLSIKMKKLSMTHNTQELHSQLLVTKALGRLDEYMKSGSKFMELYTQYQDLFYSQTDSAYKAIIEDFRKYDFQSGAHKMLALPESITETQVLSQDVKRILNAIVNNLSDETKKKAIMLGNALDIEKIKELTRKIKDLEAALQQKEQLLHDYQDIEKIADGKVSFSQFSSPFRKD